MLTGGPRARSVVALGQWERRLTHLEEEMKNYGIELPDPDLIDADSKVDDALDGVRVSQRACARARSHRLPHRLACCVLRACAHDPCGPGVLSLPPC